MNIIKSSASMMSNPSSMSLIETQCLFGEKIEILEKHLEWIYCRLHTDNYYGWINKNSVGNLGKTSHRVIDVRTFIYKEANIKSEIIMYLPMGSKLSINKINTHWVEVFFLYKNKIEIGYVPNKQIIRNDFKELDWVKIAEKLKGIPYRWGGRDTIGIDCSALLQLSYQTYGQNIPRNTAQQVKLKKPQIYKPDDLTRGCVIFWEGHVGIMIDNINCVHANAFHMKTVIEPLSDIVNRTDKCNGIIKMMDFN